MPTTKVPASRMVDHNIGSYCFRNKIINGDMRIDQRNAGAAATITNTNAVTLDRWRASNAQGTCTIQQIDITGVPGFNKALQWTTNTVGTISSNEGRILYQVIEGQNINDLAFGTSSARPVTLSFWVRGSLTGTYSGHIRISTGSSLSTYPFVYTITSANTWQFITVTTPGNTLRTPIYNNTEGLTVLFDMGSSANLLAPGSMQWYNDTNYHGVAGSITPGLTQGATFSVTGVQLEAGPTATPFEYRPIGTELALCQRYYETNYPTDQQVNTTRSVANGGLEGTWQGISLNNQDFYHSSIPFIVPKRARPNVALYNPVLAGGSFYNENIANAQGNTNVARAGQYSIQISCGNQAMTTNQRFHVRYTADAEL